MADDVALAQVVRELVLSAERFRVRHGRARGLSPTSLMTLGQLHLHGSATPTELAAHLDLAPTSVTEMLDKLEGAELIVRRRHPSDRRKQLVELTDDARTRIAEVYADFTARVAESAALLSTEDRATVLGFCATTVDQLRDSPPCVTA